MKYNGIVISDIHFGIKDSNILKYELDEVFIHYLNEMDKIDYIIITGDYFDHKIYLNEVVCNYAITFMDKIIEISKTHKCPVRCVYGTESHEVNQYNIFSIYENNPDIDFKVIKTVSEEYLYPDLFVLYIPEEYIHNKSEYYKDYLYNNKSYNYIFGHGIIQEAMVQASRTITKSKNKNRKSVPVFNSNELINACKGEVYFGHYHVNTEIQDKVMYVGSFTRWIHGEENPKGFYSIACNTKKSVYERKFIENIIARKYITYTYTHNTDNNIIDVLNKREALMETLNIYNLKIIVNLPENIENTDSIINSITERFKYNDKIKIEMGNSKISKSREINKSKASKNTTEYAIVFNKSAPLEDKISFYISKKFGKILPIDIIKKYLYSIEDI